MADINTGGPAFPRPQAETSQGGNFEQDGMTLRDWFAGQALSGMMASQYVSEHAGVHKTDAGMVDGLALRSYQLADALLAAREVAK